MGRGNSNLRREATVESVIEVTTDVEVTTIQLGIRWGKRGRNQKDGNSKRRLESSPSPHGYVVYSTGDKLKLPRGLSKKYCCHFTDADVACTYKDSLTHYYLVNTLIVVFSS